MKTCPKCGGQNRATANVCRLCATQLSLPESSATAMPVQDTPPSVVPHLSPVNDQLASKPSEGRPRCSVCDGAIHSDWQFCEHCGNRLPETALESGSRLSLSDSRSAIKVVRPPSADGASEGFANQSAGNSNSGNSHQHSDEAEQSDSPQSEQRAGQVQTAPQSRSRQSVPNLGLRTAVVCEACGSIQPAGGAFCAGCGAQISPALIARSLSRAGSSVVGSLHLITDGGEVGETYRLDRIETVVGRTDGNIIFPHDGYMSSRHARIIARDGRYFLVDDESRNGTFIRIRGEIELKPGDTFLAGKQVLRFDV